MIFVFEKTLNSGIFNGILVNDNVFQLKRERNKPNSDTVMLSAQLRIQIRGHSIKA